MTAAPPTVSVLMPVRNGARWLDEAVASVLAQSWTDLELVVAEMATARHSSCSGPEPARWTPTETSS